jgi:transducin (beta)-like 1
VFVCSWDPSGSLIATGSADGTGRIWNIADPSIPVIILPHSVTAEKRDVTTMEWSPDGTLLASASYDGCARIFDRNVLIHSFRAILNSIY